MCLRPRPRRGTRKNPSLMRTLFNEFSGELGGEVIRRSKIPGIDYSRLGYGEREGYLSQAVRGLQSGQPFKKHGSRRIDFELPSHQRRVQNMEEELPIFIRRRRDTRP